MAPYTVCCHFLPDLVKLIYKGADFTLRSVHGKTALDLARAFDREVVEYLDELWRGYKEKERMKQMNSWQEDEKYAQQEVWLEQSM